MNLGRWTSDIEPSRKGVHHGSEVGQKAPDFTLFNTELKAVSMKDFAGKNVVLSFYPAAFTRVCQKELCTFRDALNDFVSANTAVVGVSVDSPFANKEFAGKTGGLGGYEEGQRPSNPDRME